MTVQRHSGCDACRDLQLALHTAASLQATNRHADTKAEVLLAVQGGAVALVVQQAATLGSLGTPTLLAATAPIAIGWLVALAVGGWHLLAAITPRLVRPPGANRYAFPAGRPATDRIRDQRDEAWDLVSALAGIAVAKHTRVRRAVPALIVASASAGALLTLSAIAAMAT